MYLYIFSKLLSESLLSFYPIFVKIINISLDLQLWSRFITYIVISAFFIDFNFIYENLFSKSGLMLSFITILHVYFSYKGFLLLESGIAYTLFYTYPIMILLLSREKFNPLFILTLLGVYILSSNKKEGYNTSENDGNDGKEDKKNNTTQSKEIFNEKDVKEKFKHEGLLMILLAAFTEALIYFNIRKIKTNNNWNHIFISYFLGAIALTFTLFNKITKLNVRKTLSVSVLLNGVIGLFGYLLRFFATTHLPTKLYSSLSYFGILMSYVYGVIISKDVISFSKILGTLCIVIPNLIILLTK